MPAGLRGRVIFGKGNGMEELIKRLERVIQTGAPDKDGMHQISAETVLEVVKELSEHGTNGWELSLKAKGWHGSAKIKYCPICGRSLTHE